MAFGIADLQYVDLGPQIDEAYLAGLRTRSGIELTELATLVDGAMARINQGAHPLVAALAYQTSDPVAGRRRLGSKNVQRGGEYTVARAQVVGTTAHMLPIEKAEISLGFTEDGLHKISRARFNDELDAIVEAWQRFYLGETLTRLTSAAEIPVDEAPSTALSPGLAGSGTGGNVFTGTYPDGTALPGGYTHYFYSTPANLDATLKTMRDRLAKWQSGPFDLVCSPSMLALVTASTQFTKATSLLLRQGANANEALLDAQTFVGLWGEDVRVHLAVNELGNDEHAVMFKTHGNFAAGNVVAWRWDELEGRDVRVVSRQIYPLSQATCVQHLGFGIGNRVGAACLYVDAAAASYVAPSIVY